MIMCVSLTSFHYFFFSFYTVIYFIFRLFILYLLPGYGGELEGEELGLVLRVGQAQQYPLQRIIIKDR